MPLYEYECPMHGRYEVSQRITEAALTVCTVPGCGQPVHKLISATSFALKGGGWYSDGYASGGKKSAAGEASASPASTPAPAPASSEGAGCGAPACGGGACAAKAEA